MARLCAILLLLVGCAHSARELMYVERSMTKSEIRARLGDPVAVATPVAVGRDDDVGLVEVWEYEFRFVNGKLVSWVRTRGSP